MSLVTIKQTILRLRQYNCPLLAATSHFASCSRGDRDHGNDRHDYDNRDRLLHGDHGDNVYDHGVPKVYLNDHALLALQLDNGIHRPIVPVVKSTFLLSFLT